MGRHSLMCDNCHARPAAIEDRDPPGQYRYWCHACAFDLIKAGDPIVHFREFDEGDAYSGLLRDHATMLRFHIPPAQEV